MSRHPYIGFRISVLVLHTMNSRIFFAAVFLLMSAALRAQTGYTVHQSDAIASLLGKYKAYNHMVDYTDGFRVQIMFTDVRDEVYKSKGSLYNQFPDLLSYVEYEQPYYKLRLGDFKTRLEATYYLQQIIPVYPGAFIVRDKIKIR